MIDGVLNNGRKGEEQEKAQGEAHRGAPEKRPSIRERLAEAKRECGERKPPDRAQQKKPPEQEVAAGMVLLPRGERPPQI